MTWSSLAYFVVNSHGIISNNNKHSLTSAKIVCLGMFRECKGGKRFFQPKIPKDGVYHLWDEFLDGIQKNWGKI